MKFLLLIGAMMALPGSATAQIHGRSLTPQGYGPVTIGMSERQVRNALGVSLRGEPIDPGSTCVEKQAARGHAGMYFMFEDGRLTRISLSRPSQVRTPRAIGIGSTPAAVRRAYGSALERESHQYVDAPGEYLTFWTRRHQRGVRFEVNERGLVSAIHVGGPSIRYVEGCA